MNDGDRLFPARLDGDRDWLEIALPVGERVDVLDELLFLAGRGA